MSNGNTQWASAPASIRTDDPADAVGSVVERALSVLHQHGVRVPSGGSPQDWTFDRPPVPGIDELHTQLGRLRNQAQDIIDELVRVAEAIAVSAATGKQPTGAPLAPVNVAGAPPHDALGLAQLRRVTAAPGQVTSTQFRLVNEMRQPVEVLMKATSLIGPQGFELPSRSVGFAPNPLLLGASGALPVDVTIRVPEHVPPGEYSGLVQGVGLEGARAALTLEVTPAGHAGRETQS